MSGKLATSRVRGVRSLKEAGPSRASARWCSPLGTGSRQKANGCTGCSEAWVAVVPHGFHSSLRDWAVQETRLRAARRRPRSWALAHQSAVPHASWWSWPERPPSFDAWYGIGEGWDVHAHPPSVGRSLWSSNPVREGHRSPGTGASRTWRLGLWPKPSGATPDLLVDARTPEPAAGKRGDPPPRSGAQTAFPRRDIWTGATPRGRGQGCENTPGPAPAPGPRPGGSLPSTSVLPSAAPATGWRRTQLQATARDR